jgi:hypothetical protein
VPPAPARDTDRTPPPGRAGGRNDAAADGPARPPAFQAVPQRWQAADPRDGRQAMERQAAPRGPVERQSPVQRQALERQQAAPQGAQQQAAHAAQQQAAQQQRVMQAARQQAAEQGREAARARPAPPDRRQAQQGEGGRGRFERQER